MESGLFYGYVGMVEGLVRRMSDELGGNAVCVATGGLAAVIAPETPLIQHVDADLTLHGLRIVWERNQMTIADYCREIETYLCQKNDGHLIRVVGPSFEIVSGWAAQGVPLKVALRGIDRYFERYYRKGPRRRPVKIDFCEADVLDVFDEWRRAVGVPQLGRRRRSQAAGAVSNRQSLPAHLERVVMRLTPGAGDRSAWRRVRRADRSRRRGARRGARQGRRPARRGAAGAARAAGGARRRARAAGARHARRRRAASLAREAEAELAGFRAA